MNNRVLYIITTVGLMLAATASAQIPRTISYQGAIIGTGGEPVSDGSHTLVVKLYDALSGGTELYSQTQTVQTVDGIFNIILGSATAIPPSLSFDKPYYLGIAIDGGTELSPRTPLTAAPYALTATTATTAKGLAAGASGVVTSINGQTGAVTLQGGGGTTVTQTGGVVTISSSGGSGGNGIQGVQNTDGTIAITNPNGPIATLGLADGGVTDSKIADGTITADKIADGVIPSDLPPSGNAGGDLTGTYPDPSIAADAVTSANIADGTIATADLADSSVTTAKISGTGATSGQVLTYDGTNVVFANSDLTLPFVKSVNATDAFSITNTGTGAAGLFIINNATNGNHALRGETNGASGWNGPAGVYGKQTGASGVGVFGEATGTTTQGIPPRGVYGVSNSGMGVYGFSTAGNGVYGQANGAADAIFGLNTGTGRSGYFAINNASSSKNALEGETNGSGAGVMGLHAALTGLEPGVKGETNSSANGSGSIAGVTGVLGRATATTGGGFSAGVRGLNNSTTGNGIGVVGYQAGSGWGVLGETPNGTGVRAVAGTGGNALVAIYTGIAVSTTTSDNIAIFQAPPRTGGAAINQARIDAIGRGYFNGGTFNAGADVAEMFDVEGERTNYEPGDVLVISTNNDRTVEKSSEPYSTLVIGVHATKPGVVLSEHSIDVDHSDMVPLGVVGVIPTKVSGENGAIHRGDLLVTSDTPGHAMRADTNELARHPGAIIGKALENFDSEGKGIIRVLVNVR